MKLIFEILRTRAEETYYSVYLDGKQAGKANTMIGALEVLHAEIFRIKELLVNYNEQQIEVVNKIRRS